MRTRTFHTRSLLSELADFLHQLDKYEKKLFPDREAESPYVIQHVRSIWPEYSSELSDDAICQILENSRYNHIEILFHLKRASPAKADLEESTSQLVVISGAPPSAPEAYTGTGDS